MNLDEALTHLKNAPWLRDAAPFLNILDGRDGKARVVGGIVRDTLLGMARSSTDIDIATDLVPSEVMDRAKRAGIAAYPTGIDHGTVTLVADGISAEVTTLRQDIETDGRHARVVFGSDWEADAKRRDFTMNALYAGPDGELLDPIGGLGDCLARRVRFIGDADQRITEDRLRVYRYFRFCATHGEQKFEDVALAACERSATKLGHLSAERVGAEMLKLLEAKNCATTLHIMAKSGIIDAELISAKAIDVLAGLNVTEAANLAAVRMAVVTMAGGSVEILKQRWRLSNAMSETIEQIASAAALARGDAWFELSYRHPSLRHEAVAIAAAIDSWDEMRLAAAMSAAVRHDVISFPISGRDLVGIGFEPGPELGNALRTLEQRWIEAEGALSRAELLALARR